MISPFARLLLLLGAVLLSPAALVLALTGGVRQAILPAADAAVPVLIQRSYGIKI